MSLGTTIIGIICAVLCALPIILTSRSRKKKENAMLKALNALAAKQNGTVTEHEIHAEYAIGVDSVSKFVYFIVEKNENMEDLSIDLATIKNCEVITRKRASGSSGFRIEQLYLGLSNANRSKPEYSLEFYNIEHNSQPSGELRSIEKWNETINTLLGNKVK